MLAALALPATIASLIASTLLDPLDDSGPTAGAVAVARTVPRTITALGLVELLAAALLGVAVLSLVSLIRQRAEVLATVAGVVGVLGVVGLTAIAVSHLMLSAAAAVTPAHAAGVIDRFHGEAAVMLPLFFAAPVALPLLAITARRAALAPMWTMWVFVGFFVLDLVPVLPGGELIPLGLAFVASLGVAVRLLRRPTRADDAATAHDRAAAAA